MIYINTPPIFAEMITLEIKLIVRFQVYMLLYYILNN